jgi:hypothetical protein
VGKAATPSSTDEERNRHTTIAASLPPPPPSHPPESCSRVCEVCPAPEHGQQLQQVCGTHQIQAGGGVLLVVTA